MDQLAKPSPSQPPTLPPQLHQNDADEDDENVKQLRECSSLYMALQVKQARILYKDDPKNTKGPFKLDHLWETIRHLEKYKTVLRKPRREANISQSYEMPESPLSPNSDLSSFTINLKEGNASSGSSSVLAQPRGSKKTKLNRKVGDDVCTALNVLQGDNEKLREMMMQNNLKREQNTEMLMEKREAEKEKAATRRQMAEAHKQLADTNTWTEDNKILMMNLDIISLDVNISKKNKRELYERERCNHNNYLIIICSMHFVDIFQILGGLELVFGIIRLVSSVI